MTSIPELNNSSIFPSNRYGWRFNYEPSSSSYHRQNQEATRERKTPPVFGHPFTSSTQIDTRREERRQGLWRGDHHRLDHRSWTGLGHHRTDPMLLITGNLYDFFLGKVAPAVPQYDIRPEEGVYIAKLLADRSEPQQGPSTLFDLYKQAVEEGGPTAVKCYKEIGDRSLFLVGAFPKHLNRRRGVGERYYRQMGSSAYSNLSILVRDERYRYLANKFDACVNLIQNTMRDIRWAQNRNQNDLIEKWIVGSADGKEIARKRSLKK